MARRKVWAEQHASFFNRATLDMDGTLVATTGACKVGMDIAYDGTWGYHPLVISLAETGEVLRLLNRSGKPALRPRCTNGPTPSQDGDLGLTSDSR